MRVALLTREYPPEIYGGAGVHVEYLSDHLANLVDLDVLCFGRSAPAGPTTPSSGRCRSIC
jgi:alpha-maltose-1-phosphate synthase